jgi:hypothetical protein
MNVPIFVATHLNTMNSLNAGRFKGGGSSRDSKKDSFWDSPEAFMLLLFGPMILAMVAGIVVLMCLPTPPPVPLETIESATVVKVDYSNAGKHQDRATVTFNNESVYRYVYWRSKGKPNIEVGKTYTLTVQGSYLRSWEEVKREVAPSPREVK